ncbi:MAG: HIT family protein [Actinomycetia bacterium]|nr:HIT family protein [Actinomycetes bacterium]
MADATCLFCRIARGEAPAWRLFEDAETVAFLDIAPAAPGHVLVIPRRHVATLLELEPSAAPAVVATIQRAGRALLARMGADGFHVFQANGTAAGQSIFHLHFHVVPRRHGVRLTQRGPGMNPRAAPEDLAAVAERLGPGFREDT